jgi:hypothetical protein
MQQETHVFIFFGLRSFEFGDVYAEVHVRKFNNLRESPQEKDEKLQQIQLVLHLGKKKKEMEKKWKLNKGMPKIASYYVSHKMCYCFALN